MNLKINISAFNKEVKHLISLLEKVNDGDLNDYIDSLSSVITFDEQYSEYLYNKDFAYLRMLIGRLIDFSKNDITQDIDISLSILICSSSISEYGIITYPNCREMEYFNKDDIKRISNILNTPIVYETDDFIASTEFIKDCQRIYPSK